MAILGLQLRCDEDPPLLLRPVLLCCTPLHLRRPAPIGHRPGPPQPPAAEAPMAMDHPDRCHANCLLQRRHPSLPQIHRFRPDGDPDLYDADMGRHPRKDIPERKPDPAENRWDSHQHHRYIHPDEHRTFRQLVGDTPWHFSRSHLGSLKHHHESQAHGMRHDVIDRLADDGSRSNPHRLHRGNRFL